MSDQNNSSETLAEKTLSVAPPKLTLKRPVEQGMVRQSFSHGRTKQVVVEKVKRRVHGTGGAFGTDQEESGTKGLDVASLPKSALKLAPAPLPLQGAKPQELKFGTKAQEAAPDVAKDATSSASASLNGVTEALPGQNATPVGAPASALARPEESQAPGKLVKSRSGQANAPELKKPDTVPAELSGRSAPGARVSGKAAPARNFEGKSAPDKQALDKPAADRPAPPARGSGMVLRSLTDEERQARARALAGAKTREEEDRRRAEYDAKLREERRKREEAEREAQEALKKEEEERRAKEVEARRKAEEEQSRRSASTSAAGKGTDGAAARRPLGGAGAGLGGVKLSALLNVEDEEHRRVSPRRGVGGKLAPASVPKSRGADKSRGRLTIQNIDNEEEERVRSVAAFRRRVQRLRGAGVSEQKEKIARDIIIPEAITIQELANRMSERGVDVIKLLMKQGQLAKITDVLDADTAQLIAEEMGHRVKRVSEADVEEGLFDTPDSDLRLVRRAPVVTIMGHVDHGKTSLLDALRSANVVSGEAGGITQHIGAYQVRAPGGELVTFIDTPGHAAFTAMRARGAKVTDVVVLVVAADDGVMPQTVEAINHARSAKAPLIVAINKIDKPDAQPERVRTELLQHEIQVESLGGETLDVEVSATKKTNLDKLLEAIILQAEILDLKANPDRPAEGTVIEARLDRGRGSVATVLVQRGTLRVGDIVIAGAQWGRVRALIDDTGVHVDSAGPSKPVEILGFSGAPEAGDRIGVVENEARAREITDYRERQRREQMVVRGGAARGTLADMMSQIKTAGRKEVPVVIKGDVQGSVEAISAALEKLGTDEVACRLVHGGVGGISESDVTLAAASNAVIFGFNVRAHKEARAAADQQGIEIRYYNIIYNLVDDVKATMSGMLAPTRREHMLGNAEILEVFTISKVGKVAGCRVTDGTVLRGANVRLIRDNVVVHEGKLSTLKRYKDEVKEVMSGQECGMAFEAYQDMRQGDIIECYRVEEIARSL